MSNANRRGGLVPRMSELALLACRSVAAPSVDVAVPALKSIDSNRLERVKELDAGKLAPDRGTSYPQGFRASQAEARRARDCAERQ